MDVLCLISNCPQINNPCNGFFPTPVQVTIFDLERGLRHVHEGPDRQPRRDRRAGSSGHCDRMGIASVAVYSRRRPLTRPRARRRRGGAHRRRRRRRRATSTSMRSWRRARRPARRRCIPATGSFGERRLCRAAARRGHRLHRADARSISTLSASSTRRARSPSAAACRCCRAPACSRRSRRRVPQPKRSAIPVMLKSTAGGGGIGMQLCQDDARAARRLRLRAAHGAGKLRRRAACISKASSPRARHIEVQIFGDGKGDVVALGERDCSLQRRNQKVIEETPAPGSPPSDARRAPRGRGRARARRSHYDRPAPSSSSTTSTREDFYFLEVNTRLQVEHRVTEAGHRRRPGRVDDPPGGGRGRAPDAASLTPKGAAIEVRLYAEEPGAGFRPTAGRLTQVAFPPMRARRRLDRDRHRGVAVLRSDAGQDHRRRPRRAMPRSPS